MYAVSWLALLNTLVETEPLTTLGATIMLLSIGSVLSLMGFCLHRVLTIPPMSEDALKCPLEIDTGDIEDPD